MSKRRSRRSFGEGVVRVFAVVSARELAEAHGGNGERWFRCFGCGGEGRKRRNELRHRGALGGVLRLVLALSGPTWPGRSGRR